MKPRLVIVVSAIAFAILIIIQVYMIRGYFGLKSRDFDMQYAQVVYNSLGENDQYSRIFSFDSLNYIFNHLALNYLNQPGIFGQLSNPEIRQKIRNHFSQILSQYEKNRQIIIQYLKTVNLDTSFVSHYVINQIAFLDFDSIIPVFQRKIKNTLALNNKMEGFFVKSYTIEGDFYLLKFDYYADFTRKSAIILAEMKGLMFTVIITIIAVLLAFIYTLYSYANQKKLADLKGDFIDHITHEFKTPLSTISVAVSSLKRTKIKSSSEQIDEITGIISKQNRFLTQMIEHVLDVSQMERKQLILEKRNTRIKKYFQQLVQDFRMEHHDKSCTIHEEYLINDELQGIIDPLQFSRVIQNVLSNAVKYSSGIALINIRITGNEKIKIDITDNGIGIPKTELEHIFTKFYRVKNEFSGGVKGLGLGLYLVKMIVEAHEGTVDAESEPGRGTTIVIQLPVKQE